LTEPAEGLAVLVELPPSPPPPVEDLRRRVGVRRRRRRRLSAALVGVGVVVTGVAVAPLVGRSSDAPTQVVAGPGTETTTTSTTIPLDFVAGQAVSYRVDFTAPAGWQTLYKQGDQMMVATRPLAEPDKGLAQLARNDASFTSAFPADAVVVVVGNDPAEAKYTMNADGTMVGPGPAYALGPAKVLDRGVRVRRGDIPQSGVKIATYAGPSAPANRLAEAEQIVAGIRLVRTGDPSVIPRPPPPGSRPGLPSGTLPVPEAGMSEVARASAAGSTLVLVAGGNCAYLRWADAQTSLPGYAPLAGGCGTRPEGTFIETIGQPVPVTRGPGTDGFSVTILRSGPSVAHVSARLADGRTVPASIGTEGWALVAADGRIVAVSGIDVQGRSVPETLVG